MYCSQDIYNTRKTAFYRAHGDFKEHCSLNGDVQRKQVVFQDGAVWYEVSAPETQQLRTITELPDGRFLESYTDVKLFVTEFWTTEDAESNKICDFFTPPRHIERVR